MGTTKERHVSDTPIKYGVRDSDGTGEGSEIEGKIGLPITPPGELTFISWELTTLLDYLAY